MSNSHKFYPILLFVAVSTLCISSTTVCAQSAPLTDVQKLGKSIFFDQNLSIDRNQSCASCHAPESGWTGPVESTNAYGAVYEGSIPGRFGNRKPPSAAYATQSPVLFQDSHGLWIGGNFWDGRATGKKLGNPAADQAQGPFLNPAEQALPDSACVVYRACSGSYSELFRSVTGDGCSITWPDNIESVCMNEGSTVALAPSHRVRSNSTYDQMGLIIAAYEASPEVNAFTSKFDLARKDFTPQERKGWALFQGKGKCAKCHTSTGKAPLFTDYTFDNLGTPKNLENPVYALNPGFLDLGLGGYLSTVDLFGELAEGEMGKVKVPTLRNVAKRPYADFQKAYGHNGYFKSLTEIVHFYNTRDVLPIVPKVLRERR